MIVLKILLGGLLGSICVNMGYIAAKQPKEFQSEFLATAYITVFAICGIIGVVIN